MFIELVDSLRCPHAHEESWLVLGAGRMEGRDVMEGVLGCPVCRAQYGIADGVADLRTGDRATVAPPASEGPPAGEAEQAMRLAAFLNLAGGGGFAVLVGEWTRHAAGVRALTDTHLLLANPVPGVRIGGGTSGVLVDRVLPVAGGSARGLAIDVGDGRSGAVPRRRRGERAGGRPCGGASRGAAAGGAHRTRARRHDLGGGARRGAERSRQAVARRPLTVRGVRRPPAPRDTVRR